jgi:hypothetical protein
MFRLVASCEGGTFDDEKGWKAARCDDDENWVLIRDGSYGVGVLYVVSYLSRI